MDNKNIRELSMDEMDQVSGGTHDTEENRREFGVYKCTYCEEIFTSNHRLQTHIKDKHPEL